MLRKLITTAVAATAAGTSTLLMPPADAAPNTTVQLGGVHDPAPSLETELVVQRLLVG